MTAAVAAPIPGIAAPRSKWLTLLAACSGLMMLYVDLFIVNVALPSIGRDFQAPASLSSWTIVSYALMIGVFPMGVGRLADLLGQRRIYLVGLGIFTAASLACGLAPNIALLIVARIAQGLGAAIMTPSTLAIVTRAFPPEQRGLAIGLYSSVSGIGLIAGPLLGGFLVQLDSWRLVFFINVPLGLAAIALSYFAVPEARDPNAKVVDWPGLGLLSAGLFGLLFAVTHLSEREGLAVVFGGALLGIAALAGFVYVERRVRYPLIDLAIFRNRTFVMANVSFFLFSAALFGSQPFWSLFMQNFWGFSPLSGGLAFLPATVLIVALTPFAGVFSQRASERRWVVAVVGTLLIGLSFMYVYGYVLMFGERSSYEAALLPAFILRGVGIPLVSACVSLAIMNALPAEQAGLAAGTLGMSRNIGTAAGVAILGALVLFQVDGSTTAAPGADLQAMRSAAAQFLAGDGPLRDTANALVLNTFAVTSLVCALFCAAASIAAIFIRGRLLAILMVVDYSG